MIGRSMLAYIPVNLANVFVSFGTIVILTRLLGSAEFGRYALAMITLQFVHMGLFTWLEAALARYQANAEERGEEASHLKTIFISAARLSVIGWAFITAVLYALPLDPHMKMVLVVALTSTCIQLFCNLGMEAHKASHRIGRYSALYTTQMLLSFTIGILLIMVTPLREVAPFVGIIIAILIIMAIDLPFMLRRAKGGQMEPKRVKKYFIYGMPICISLLLTYALNTADMFLIAGMLGEAKAGAYNAGYNLANRSLEVIFIWVSMAVTPIAITALERDGIERSQEVLKNYGATLLLIAMPAATGLALVAEPAGFILGESVREDAITVMPLIAFAGVLNGLITYYAHRAFMLSGRTDMFVWAMVPPVILNIGLNLILIPKMQLMGAVWATVAAYALGLVISIIVGRRYYPLPLPLRAAFQVTLACAVMGFVVYYVPVPETTPDFIEIIIRAGVGVPVYVALCLLVNIADCRDLAVAFIEKIRRRQTAETVS